MPELSRLSEIESTSQRLPCLPASPDLIDFGVTSLVVSVSDIVYEGPYLDPQAPKGLNAVKNTSIALLA